MSTEVKLYVISMIGANSQKNNDVKWLTEMRSHPVIFFDLTLNILHPVEQHERAFLLFIDRLICVLAQRELPGAFCDMPDGMEHIGQ